MPQVPTGRLAAAVLSLPNASRFTGNLSQLNNDLYRVPSLASYTLTGPWPQTSNVVLAGGTQAWMVSTSAYANTAGVVTGVKVAIDGTVSGQSALPFNLTGCHTTLPTVLFGTTLAAGTHSVTVSPLNGNLASSVFDTCSFMVSEYGNSYSTVRSGVVQGPWSNTSVANVVLGGGIQNWVLSTSVYAANSGVSSVTGVQVGVDGSVRANASLAFNQVGVHASLPTVMFTTNLAAGTHSLSVTPLNGACGSSVYDSCSYMVNEFRGDVTHPLRAL